MAPEQRTRRAHEIILTFTQETCYFGAPILRTPDLRIWLYEFGSFGHRTRLCSERVSDEYFGVRGRPWAQGCGLRATVERKQG
jgi:hypothetical protein